MTATHSVFRHVDPSALSIPGRMDLDELAFLSALAAQVPKGGTIVEVGALFGRSTRAMARANTSAQVTSIDMFNPAPWTNAYAAQYHDIPTFSQAAFAKYMQDEPNVRSIKGTSPDIAQGWSTPIDLYFDDATHGNPDLRRNLDFWIDKLAPGGILCGHDYSRRFPDVKREADAQAAIWGADLSVVGTLWSLQKPPIDQAPERLAPALTAGPQITLHSVNKIRGKMSAPPGYWCGAHLEPDRLRQITVEAPDALGLEVRLGSPNHGSTEWIPAGRPARLLRNGREVGFTRFAARLSKTARFDVMYRVSARKIGKGGSRRSGTSQWARNGDWAALPFEGPALNAITVTILNGPIPEAQSHFRPRARHLMHQISKQTLKALLARVKAHEY